VNFGLGDTVGAALGLLLFGAHPPAAPMVVIRTATATVIVTANLLDTIVPFEEFGVNRPLEAPYPSLQFVLDTEEQDQGQPPRL
jgi:hypothetical protein